MNFKKLFIFSILFFSLLSTSCSNSIKFKKETIEIKKTDKTTVLLKVELAKTEEEKRQGFMFRKKIPDGTGMIFIYKSDLQMHFWMKDTPTPLDIAFIDSKGVIKEIKTLRAFSLDVVSSTFYVRYALELPQGWLERVGICVGDSISKSSLEKITKN